MKNRIKYIYTYSCYNRFFVNLMRQKCSNLTHKKTVILLSARFIPQHRIVYPSIYHTPVFTTIFYYTEQEIHITRFAESFLVFSRVHFSICWLVGYIMIFIYCPDIPIIMREYLFLKYSIRQVGYYYLYI